VSEEEKKSDSAEAKKVPDQAELEDTDLNDRATPLA
jgi:hypothetical protein